MPTDEGTYNGFNLSSMQGKRENDDIFYRLHAVKSEQEVFTVRPYMTDERVEFGKESDHFAILKEDAVQEVKRRIDAGDFEPKATYERVFSRTSKSSYRKAAQ